MSKESLERNSHGSIWSITAAEWVKQFLIFPERTSLKMKEILPLEFELYYYAVAVQYVSPYFVKTLQIDR